MATELASAYLTLIPSLSGAQKKIEAQLSGIDVSKQGKRMGSSLASGIGGGLKAVGKIGAGAVAAIGASVAGLALGGGVSRALKLDQARFKFRALEMDVERTMASCNEAVSGTAFGLDAAATVATQLGAAGVESGDAMTGALKSVAGVAAMASTSMEDVGAIFAKVAAKGKVGGDELMQLTERGINATAALAKHLGKTSDEVTKMVSKGEIDFATFAAAMQETFGEAAAGANETFQGAASNVMAALSRIGAKFASPALDGLRRVFVATIPAVDAVSKALDPVVDKFSSLVGAFSGRAVSAIDAFTATVESGGGAASAFGSAFRAMADGTRLDGLAQRMADPFLTWRGRVTAVMLDVGDSVPRIAESASRNVNMAFAKMGINLPAISDGVARVADSLRQGFADAGFELPSFDGLTASLDFAKAKVGELVQGFIEAKRALADKGAIGGFFDSVAEKAGSVGGVVERFVSAVSGLFDTLSAKVSEVFGRMNADGVGLAAVFGGVMALFGGHIGIAVKAVMGVGSVVKGAIDGVMGIGSAFVTAGGGIKGLTALLGAFFSPVGLVVAAVAALAAGFVYLMATSDGFRGTVTGLVGQIGSSLAPIISIVGQALANLASTVLPLVSSMIAMMVPVIGQIITVILQVVAALAPVITMLVATLVPIITQIIQMVVMVASQVLAAVMPVISMVLLAIQTSMPMIQTIITAVMSVIVGIIETAWPTIQGIIEAAMGVIQAVIDNVWPVMQTVIETAMTAIQDVISIVTAAISGDWDGMWNGVKKLLEDVWEGMKKAVEEGVDAVYNTVIGIKDSILGFFDGAGSWLVDAGSSILHGLWDGISGALGWLGDQLAGIGDFIISHKGPKAYDLKMLVPNGGWIMQSLSTGIERGIPGLERTLAGVSRSVEEFGAAMKPFDRVDVGAKRLSFASAGGGAHGGVNNYITLNVDAHDLDGINSVDRFVRMLEFERIANPTR